MVTKEGEKIMKRINNIKEQGSAIVLALLVMALLMAFVALAVSRTANETMATSNDAVESQTFVAAQASLENATREFDLIFQRKLSPSQQDVDDVEAETPPNDAGEAFAHYAFNQEITRVSDTATVNTASGHFLQGLKSLRDEWQIDSTATHRASGVQVALRRRFFNDRVPIFQFGIFYNDDLEFHPGPRFDFGGRVHANGNLYLMAGTGLYFSSRVSATGEIVTDVARNGTASTHWGDNVWVRNGAGVYKRVTRFSGSALNTVVNGSNLLDPPAPGQPPSPPAYRNANWITIKEQFNGNLLSSQNELKLPMKISAEHAGTTVDYRELIQRSRNVGDKFNDGSGTNASPSVVNVTNATKDSPVMTQERFANKPGLRISLADTRDRLPGCANALPDSASSDVNRCGVRLDGRSDGKDLTPTGSDRGYQPRTLANGDVGTRVNGERLDDTTDARQTWIKIEMMQIDEDGEVQTEDVTEDILALGVTERAPVITDTGTGQVKFSINGYNNSDLYSIIQLQRFIMPGVAVKSGNSDHFTSYTWNGVAYNLVQADETIPAGPAPTPTPNRDRNPVTSAYDYAHQKLARVDGNIANNRKVVPFPIMMFDTREGLYNDSLSISSTFGSSYHRVPRAGVMSMVDINVGNLRAFLNGSYNSLMPAGTKFATAKGRALRAADIPQANGWVVYFSDRRGDYDFDGRYDMEDIYGHNDGTLQPGEDVNKNGALDTNYANEAVTYSNLDEPDRAPFVDTRYYRRGVRLVNAQTIPGIYDADNPLNTRGFTFASENGVYVLGNYNAIGITTVGSPTPSTNYSPQNTANHIPASIIGDAVTILSRSWLDSRSFRYPFTLSQRPVQETTIRFAMMSGDAISSVNGTPNQGGGDPRMTGGVHNFKRFLENWSSTRLNYSGSLINLYNAQNNNGSFKCCTNVYNPPTRNWTFDLTFLDPTRLPPGTPFFQQIQLTGFQRLNE